MDSPTYWIAYKSNYKWIHTASPANKPGRLCRWTGGTTTGTAPTATGLLGLMGRVVPLTMGINIFTYVWFYVHMHSIYVYLHMCICMYIYNVTHLYMYYVYIYTYMYVFIYGCTYDYICTMHKCDIHLCTVCIYMYFSLSLYI